MLYIVSMFIHVLIEEKSHSQKTYEIGVKRKKRSLYSWPSKPTQKLEQTSEWGSLFSHVHMEKNEKNNTRLTHKIFHFIIILMTKHHHSPGCVMCVKKRAAKILYSFLRGKRKNAGKWLAHCFKSISKYIRCVVMVVTKAKSSIP